MKSIAFILSLICSTHLIESSDVRQTEDDRMMLVETFQESHPNNTATDGMRDPAIWIPSHLNKTSKPNLKGTNRYVVLGNGTLRQDRIHAGALGDNSNGLNTGFGLVGGVGSGMSGLPNNLAFGQPYGSAGNPLGSVMSTGGTGGGGNLFPGYGYGMFPGMNVGTNFPGSNGNVYFPGNGFGNNPYPGIIPGYGYGMFPGNWYPSGSLSSNGVGYGYGGWNGNSYGWGNGVGMGANPWFRKAPIDGSSSTTTLPGNEN